MRPVLVGHHDGIVLHVGICAIGLLDLHAELAGDGVAHDFEFDRIRYQITIRRLGFGQGVGAGLELDALRLIPLTYPGLRFEFGAIIQRTGEAHGGTCDLRTLEVLLGEPHLLVFGVVRVGDGETLGLRAGDVRGVAAHRIFAYGIHDLLAILVDGQIGERAVVPPVSNRIECHALIGFLSVFQQMHGYAVRALLVLVVGVVPCFFNADRRGFGRVRVGALFGGSRTVGVVLHVSALRVVPAQRRGFDGHVGRGFAVDFHRQSRPLHVIVLVGIEYAALPVDFRIIGIAVGLAVQIEGDGCTFAVLVVIVVPCFRNSQRRGFRCVLRLHVTDAVATGHIFAVDGDGAVFADQNDDRIHDLVSVRCVGFGQLVPSGQEFERFRLAAGGGPCPIGFHLRRSDTSQLHGGTVDGYTGIRRIHLCELHLELRFVVVAAVPTVVAQCGRLAVAVFGYGDDQFAALPVYGNGFVVVSSVVCTGSGLRVMSGEYHIERSGFLVLRISAAGHFAVRTCQLGDLIYGVVVQLQSVGQSVGCSCGQLLGDFFANRTIAGAIGIGRRRHEVASGDAFHFEGGAARRLAEIAVGVFVNLQCALVVFHTAFALLHGSGDRVLRGSAVVLIPGEHDFVAAQRSEAFAWFELHRGRVGDGACTGVGNGEH